MSANLIIKSRNKEKLNILSSKLKNSKTIICDMECEYSQREEKAKLFIDESLSISDSTINGFVCNAEIKSDKLSIERPDEE